MSSLPGDLQTRIDAMSDSTVQRAAQEFLDFIGAQQADEAEILHQHMESLLNASAVGSGIPIYYSGFASNGRSNEALAEECQEELGGDSQAYLLHNTGVGAALNAIDHNITYLSASVRAAASSLAANVASARMAAEAVSPVALAFVENARAQDVWMSWELPAMLDNTETMAVNGMVVSAFQHAIVPETSRQILSDAIGNMQSCYTPEDLQNGLVEVDWAAYGLFLTTLAVGGVAIWTGGVAVGGLAGLALLTTQAGAGDNVELLDSSNLNLSPEALDFLQAAEANVVDANQQMLDHLEDIGITFAPQTYNLGMDTSAGTAFDNLAYGFDISTAFIQGSLEQETQTLEDELQALIDNGQLISGGNYAVTSLTVNDPGFWTNVNFQIGDGHQPGRANIAGSTSPDLISAVVGGYYDKYYNDGTPGPLLPFAMDLSHVHSFSQGFAEIDPLILDLDGDGVELVSFADQYLFFDIDNDGAVEKTGWVGADDAILVRDLNSNGVIDNITETLSEYYGAPAGSGAIYTDGFAALATLDGNSDGRIDATDAAYSSLRLWQDADSDGETDAGELTSLAAAGVASISLANTPDGAFTGGNEVKANGTYTRTNGSTATIAAVNFIADPNGLTQSASGSGTQITLQDGLQVYSVGSAAGEAVNLAWTDMDAAIGGTGNDTLIGTSGDNWLTGNLGEDILSGGAGNDYLVADAEDIAQTQSNIDGGAGFDIVQFVGNHGVAFNLQQSQVEMAVGTAQADILASGSSDHSIIAGGAGDDVILGGSADDVLNGEEGADSIYGYQGDDLIRGHRGGDALVGGEGEDLIFGGLGNDLVSGQGGDDLLNGGEGDDLLDGGDGYDVAEYAGSYGDYVLSDNGDGSYTVADRRPGSPEGTDTLKDVEALNFADIKEVQIAGNNPLPVSDVVDIAPDSDGLTYRIPFAQLLANDLDYQGDSLSIREVSGAVGGTATLSGNEVVFVADADFHGIPSFSYKIQDAGGHHGTQVGVSNQPGVTEELTATVRIKLASHPDDPQFLDQWYLPEINVLQVWEDYTGAGVSVGIVEPGPWDASEPGQIDYSHPDLAANIDPDWLHKVNPHIEATTHATLVGGVIGAARNGTGGVGVAYEATLASDGFTEAELIASMSDVSSGWKDFDVINHSWLPTNPLTYDFFPNVNIQNFSGNISTTWFDNSPFRAAVEQGRDGLGTVFVSGAGNSRQDGANANHYNFANSRQTVTVAAINQEGDLGALQLAQEPFSNPGAPILISAPGSNIKSTSRLLTNDNGTTFGDNYEDARGTSFATPIVSGVVALMLEANPDLGYRDVQKILAYSARQVDPNGSDWAYNGAANWNGGGLHVSGGGMTGLWFGPAFKHGVCHRYRSTNQLTSRFPVPKSGGSAVTGLFPLR